MAVDAKINSRDKYVLRVFFGIILSLQFAQAFLVWRLFAKKKGQMISSMITVTNVVESVAAPLNSAEAAAEQEAKKGDSPANPIDYELPISTTANSFSLRGLNRVYRLGEWTPWGKVSAIRPCKVFLVSDEGKFVVLREEPPKLVSEKTVSGSEEGGVEKKTLTDRLFGGK